ncbi:MAG: hypothetical protein U1E10_17150 [Bdellovibrionales bacterium]|nr:hypothetical protein [Bdellovibrionales bacterium]
MYLTSMRQTSVNGSNLRILSGDVSVSLSTLSFFVASLFVALALLVPKGAMAAASCEDSFKTPSEGASAASEVVYVLKFDTGAGFNRVVSGRIFMVERDSNGEANRVEVFHDRGTGIYAAGDVFHPIRWPSRSLPRHQWRKALGLDGYTPVQLIAADSSGHRFIGRNRQGALKLYQSHELFPLGSSNR